MNENISKLMHLEQRIIKFINDHDNLQNKEIDNEFNDTHYVDKCINILKRMSNMDLLESIVRFEYIPMLVDYKAFLKKYTINKKNLKENPKECIDEYNKLNNICMRIVDVSNNRKEYSEYLKILDVDNAFDEILKIMPNEDLNKLSQSTSDWTEKMYFYSFFKKN